MSNLSLVPLALTVFVLAITPGPGVFATIGRALSHGFFQAAAMAAGIVCGDLLYLMLALYGLSAVAQLLGDLFLLIRFLGSGYLILLGLLLILTQTGQDPGQSTPVQATGSSFCSGLTITLGNPKVIVFYLGFLPGFLDMRQIHGSNVLMVAATVVLVLGSVLLGYAFLAAQARNILTGSQARHNLNRGAGCIMIGTGSALLATTKP